MSKFIVTTIGAIAVFVAASTGVMACDAAEATAKFSKRAEQLGAGTVPDNQVAEAWAKMNEGGTALASQDYDKACEIYDAIADAYGLEK